MRSRYPPICFPTGNRSCSVSLPTSSLSHPEQILQGRASPKFSFPPGTDPPGLSYPQVLFPTWNRSWRVALATSSLSYWEQSLQGRATPKFSFPPGTESVGSPTPKFSFPQGTDPAGSRYLQVLFRTGNRSCRVALPPSCLSHRAQIL